jgi:hypothetical protein
MRRVFPRARIGLLCAAVLGTTVLSVLPPGPAGAATATLTAAPPPGTGTRAFAAAADARMAKTKPTTNFGTTPTLAVDAGPVIESYLRFPVTGLAGPVRRATLRLWVTDKSVDGPAVYPTGNGWTETGITWATKPAPTGPKTDDLGALAKSTWAEFDVTPVVTGNGDWSFDLAGTSADATVFASREAANPPQLVVTADVAPPDTTPPDTALGPVTVNGSTATFPFTSTEANSTFECSLDGAAFAPCTAPVAYSDLVVGDHAFAVRATDAAGNTDPSPALSHFTIAPGSIRAALLAPASGAWFGLYAHTDVYTQADSQAALTNLEAALGRTADIDHWYEPWGRPFPTWRQPWDFANGRIPMISWGKQSSDVILSGADDAYIAARADGVKALGRNVFLRWFWEMDGSRNLASSQSPAAYIAAWRHIHDIFTARGATNVAWVWCPNASSFKTGNAQQYYPGDDAVDWICADGYNFYPDSAYREFEPIFASFYAWASQRPKPLMIGEYGDQQAAPGQRAAWVDAAHAALMAKYPRILAVVYFHSNSLHNWMFSAEPDALEAFRRMALDPYFNPPRIYPRP